MNRESIDKAELKNKSQLFLWHLLQPVVPEARISLGTVAPAIGGI